MVRNKRDACAKRVHSGLEPQDYDRLLDLAGKEKSSLSRIVRLAILSYLDMHDDSKLDDIQ